MSLDHITRVKSFDIDPDAALAELEALSAMPFFNPDAIDPFTLSVEASEDATLSEEDDKLPVFPDMTAEEWIRDAACGSLPAILFMPERETKERVKTAKAICGKCSVRSACLEYAIKNNEPIGVWGGLTRRERAKVSLPREHSQSTPQ